MNNKRTLVDLYKDIVLFTNNNIKVVIQMNAFLFDLQGDIPINQSQV